MASCAMDRIQYL